MNYEIDPTAALVLAFLSGIAVGTMLVTAIIRLAVCAELRRLHKLEEKWDQREAVERLKRRG